MWRFVKEHTDLTPGYELGHPSLNKHATINKLRKDTRSHLPPWQLSAVTSTKMSTSYVIKENDLWRTPLLLRTFTTLLSSLNKRSSMFPVFHTINFVFKYDFHGNLNEASIRRARRNVTAHLFFSEYYHILWFKIHMAWTLTFTVTYQFFSSRQCRRKMTLNTT